MTGTGAEGFPWRERAVFRWVVALAAACLLMARGPVAAKESIVAPDDGDMIHASAVEENSSVPPAAAEAPAAPAAVAGDSLRAELQVVVYYFHRTVRCDNCLKFEEYSRRAVEEAFANELETGHIVWRVINIDDPENERTIREYDIFESAVVVVRLEDGEVSDWKKLGEVWGLVAYPDLFMQYVKDEVRGYLARDEEPSQRGESAVPETSSPAAAVVEEVRGTDRKKEGELP